jgi:heme exporter protein A
MGHATAQSPFSQTPLIKFVDVSVSLGGFPVLSDVGLTLHPGESLGVAGPNGAGKSTLLATVATFVPPSAGAATVLGAPLGTASALAIRPQIGWSGHHPALYPDLTLKENLALCARLEGRPPMEGTMALKKVGLREAGDIRVEKCSNGMKRRADLARLLIGRPRLILLDEPDAGLDREAASIIGYLIKRTTTQGGAVICVSHDAGRLSSWTHRVVEIREGTIRS